VIDQSPSSSSFQTASDLNSTMSIFDHSDIEAWSTPYGQSLLASEAAFYATKPRQYKPPTQPPQPAVALMPKNRRIQQNTSKGLFSWPRECREALYLAVIHPYCNLPRVDKDHVNRHKGSDCDYRYDHKKAMKLMVLCTQVWEEAIEIVHLAENVLYVTGQKGPIFRHPRDFGKPGFFQTSVRSTMLEIPPFLSEGQMLRMRRVAINVSFHDYTHWQYDGTHNQKMKVEFSAIVAALRKSHCLEQVRVILNREENRGYWGDIEQGLTYDEHLPMRNLLIPLIDMAHERGIKIGAEHNRDGVTVYTDAAGAEWLGSDVDDIVSAKHDVPRTDPLVTWFNNAAILPELKAKFSTPYNQETKEMLEKNLGRCKSSELPYKLVPECRSCLEVFGDWEDLATHLEKHPKHIECDIGTRSGTSFIDSLTNMG
jgi:hypothetical protein